MKARSHQLRLGIACPHCNGPSRVRSSRGITSTYRQLFMACLDPECGHTFGVELTVTHTISPSAKPNPDVSLRTAPPRRRGGSDLPTPANDDVPEPANDLCGPEVPRATLAAEG